eukprot:COSAG02_NODE_2657_length_8315_cov_11.405307_4_plen_289_part_00
MSAIRSALLLALSTCRTAAVADKYSTEASGAVNPPAREPALTASAWPFKYDWTKFPAACECRARTSRPPFPRSVLLVLVDRKLYISLCTWPLACTGFGGNATNFESEAQLEEIGKYSLAILGWQHLIFEVRSTDSPTFVAIVVVLTLFTSHADKLDGFGVQTDGTGCHYQEEISRPASLRVYRVRQCGRLCVDASLPFLPTAYCGDIRWDAAWLLDNNHTWEVMKGASDGCNGNQPCRITPAPYTDWFLQSTKTPVYSMSACEQMGLGYSHPPTDKVRLVPRHALFMD